VCETRVRVRYAETDKMGVVYYANYLAYFEAGRTEYMREIGHSYAELEDRGVLLVVAEAHCRYRAPARYDEIITVRTWVSRLRRTRIDFRYEILGPTGQALADGWTVLGCLDQGGRPQMLPDEIREAIEPEVIPEQCMHRPDR